MNNNIKAGIGLLVPATAVVAFFFSIFTENYLLGIFLSISGVLVWFLYTAVVETQMPSVTGNIIILFGVLLSFAVFLNYGWERNMFGGFVFNIEGGVGSAVLLFFSVLLGVLFKNNTPVLSTPEGSDSASLLVPEINSAPEEVGGPTEEGLDDSDLGDGGEGYSPNDYADYYEEYYQDYQDEEE